MRRWYGELAPRERVMVTGGAVAAALIVFFGFVWLPLGNASDELRQSVEAKRQLLLELQRVAALPEDAAPAPASAQSLVVLVDRTAQAHDLAGSFTRTRPDGRDGIAVSFTSAAFDDLVSWLVTLDTEYRVSVESASFNGTRERGLVTGQIFLRRS